MQKKLMAVAVAGALGLPAVALAQTSTVQIFGTMYTEYTKITDQGRNAANTAELSRPDYLQTPGSEIGFKGEEKLGGGLSVWFQCISTADTRGQSQNGWCGRNSALGMKGGFGNVFIGNWDTPFKRTAGPNNVGGNDTGSFGTAFLLAGDSTTTGVGVGNTIFRRRQNNSINYDSPNFGGFQVMAAFTSAQTSTGTTTTTTADKPRVISLGGQYSAGPLYVAAGYQKMNELTTTGPVANDATGWHIGASYTWGPVRFGGQYTRQEFEAGPVEPKVSAWHVGVDWRIVGPHGMRAAYTVARDVKGAPAGTAIPGVAASGPGYRPAVGSNTGADLMQIRYVYTFSKRTEFNFGYVHLDNESGAAYNLGGLNAAHLAGENQKGWVTSLRHTF